jgi:Protein of unknown function (DUF2380)
MRVFWKIATAAPLVMLVASAHAAEPKVAVFDFELVDTSLEGATYGPRSDQQARLAKITDHLRKVSNLILNMNVQVSDAKTGPVISVKSVDMRGNTDESWSRAIDWLIRYDLLATGQGVFP